MAQEGKIKVKGDATKILLVSVIVIVLAALACAYAFNHYTTEELAKFALLKYLLQ